MSKSHSVREWLCLKMAVPGRCGMWEFRCLGVIVCTCGSCGMRNCSLGEFQCIEVAECGGSSLFELQHVGVTVCRSCSAQWSPCAGVAVCRGCGVWGPGLVDFMMFWSLES